MRGKFYDEKSVSLFEIYKKKREMNALTRKIPTFHYEKSNLLRLVLFTAVFDLIFINLYKPFSSLTWYPVSEFKFFLFSSLVILTGVLVVAVSRLIMYYYTKRHALNYLQYAGWIAAEVFFMSLFYTTYSMYLRPEREVMEIFAESTENTFLVLLLPYAMLMLYFSWRDKVQKLRMIENDKNDMGGTSAVISFLDANGELRLSVKRGNLLYIESADNYVRVWYLNKGVVTSFMLRNTLKAMEETFEGTNILRCHRSYMVNFEQVKVIRREKDGIYLEFGVEKVPDIPISKTYSEKVTHWFMCYSS